MAGLAGPTGEAAAGICSPSASDPAQAVETVLCSAGGAAFADFSYGDNQQFISVSDGNFATIGANGGDDSFTVLGGSLFALTGGDGDDQFVISSGTLNQVVGGAGADAIFVNGGTVGAVSGGNGADLLVSNGGTIQLLSGSFGNDEIVVNGGAVTSVAGGPDRDVIRLLGGTVTNVRGNDGRDTVFLGPGFSVSGLVDGGDDIDQLQLQAGTASYGGEPQNFETLVIENGAFWTLSGTTLNFTSGILYESQAANALTIAPGSTLTTGIIQLLPVNALIVDGTLNASSILSAGTIGGSGTINPGGTLRLVDGILSPGSSIGTLTVNQSLQLAGSPLLLIEVDPTASPKNDFLAVNGDVTGTDDLTIQVVALNGALTADDYTAANTN